MKIYEKLKELEIEYQEYKHPAVFNVEEADKAYDELKIDALRCKNLFLRNAKGKKHFLYITEAHKTANLKELGGFLNERLSFASPERLEKYLKIKRGSVSLLNLINNENKDVILVLSKDVAEAEKVAFHPNTNEATLVLKNEDIHKFIKDCGNDVIIYED